LGAVAWGRRAAALAGLAVVEAFALFTMPILAGGRHGEVEMGAVRFLAAQPGIVRSYSLGPVQPNYGAYFKTAMIDHNVLPVPGPGQLMWILTSCQGSRKILTALFFGRLGRLIVQTPG
jgi:hypothetical protein